MRLTELAARQQTEEAASKLAELESRHEALMQEKRARNAMMMKEEDGPGNTPTNRVDLQYKGDSTPHAAEQVTEEHIVLEGGDEEVTCVACFHTAKRSDDYWKSEFCPATLQTKLGPRPHKVFAAKG